MSKPKRDAEATKAKIIAGAMKLFARNGYDATTADEIASECGVNKAMLFYYYKNKAGVYAAVMGEALSAIHKEVIGAEKCCESPLADLETFIKTYTLYSEKHPYLPALLLRELSDSGAHLPESLFTEMRRLFSLLGSILAEGEKQGIFHNVKPMIVYFMIIGTINMFITTKPLREKAAALDSGLDTCHDCKAEEIAAYIFEKTKLMLEVTDEKIPACA